MENVKSKPAVSYSLIAALASEFTKVTSLRSLWYGLVPILGFAAYFRGLVPRC